jgi:aspartate/methionine/tyrosine aminotransferase
LERFFAKHEFQVKYPASASDCETFSLTELLALANNKTRNLWINLQLGYTETAGHPALRDAVAALYQSACRADVLIMAPEEAIFVAMHALLSPGDHVIGLVPAYQSLLEVPAMIGCDVSEWKLVPGNCAWTLDMELLAKHCRPNTKALVINFPHNPTGFHPTRATFDKILDFARQKSLWIFSDEIYRFTELDANLRLPAVCDVYERGISFGGLSKAFGLPGLRIGWIVSHQRTFLRGCVEWRDYTTICSSAPSEILAIAALGSRQRILDRQVGILAENCKLARAFFDEYSDLLWWRPPTAGPVCIVQWRGRSPLAELSKRLLQRDVLVAPGHLFGCAKNEFRLGLGRRSFAKVLAQMREVIRADLK